MDGLKRRWIGVLIVGALPFAAAAQSPFNLDSAEQGAAKAEIGGTAAIDIITLKAIGPGAPLRYGNVVPNSERVQLDGEVLRSGQDYLMDYGTGVVYLKRAQKAGQVLTVAYRYRDKADSKAVNPFTGIGAFKYTVAPDSLNLLMGLGMTERAADGSVLQSNLMGWQNNFKLSPSASVSGLYIYGERQKTENQAGLQMRQDNPGQAAKDEGKSQFILQSLQSKLGNAKISVDYQDISSNFTNFGTVKQAGYDDAKVNQLSKERGLTRLGFNAQNVGGFSAGFRDVQDAKGAISWRSYGFNQGGLNVNWSSQRVDKAFSRFKDLAEADREQLAREAGMSRQNLAAQFSAKTAKLSYGASTIADEATGKSIEVKKYAIDSSRFKFSLEEQQVSDGFNRFQSLMAPEQAAYGREAGLKRQMMSLQTSMFGSSVPLQFSQSLISGKEGAFKSQDIALGAKTWSLEHSARQVDSGFTRLDAMQDHEIGQHITSVAKMYNAGAPNVGAEKQFFLKSSGIDRSFTRLSAQPFKDWKFSADRLKLNGQKDGGSVDTIDVSGKNAKLSYRRQNLGEQFGELASLMQFERQRLGTIAGLDRTDFGMSLNLGGARKLDVSKMTASAPAGDAARSSYAYKDKKIDVSVTTREVSSGFTNVNQLVDPEKDLLSTLRGFKQTEGKLNWQIDAKFNVSAYISDAQNPDTDEVRRVRNMVLDWSPDKFTRFHYTKLEHKNTDPLAMLFANNVERLLIKKDLGRSGKLTLLDEKVKFEGKEGKTPDWHKQFYAYETKVNEKTTVRHESTRTKFENGEKENINSNTVSTELSKRLGVSVSDVAVDRNGEERDEQKRNYGFWLDLGNGLRMSYGYVRHLNGEEAGSMSSTFAVGKGQGVIAPNQTGQVQQGSAGGLNIGGAYGVNRWDEQEGRTQAFSNVNISTAKPFRMLGFTDVKFALALDTAADKGKWLKEHRNVALSGKLAGNTLGFDYKSQIHQSGYRGIDRTFVFETDQAEKHWLRASLKYKVRTLPWDEVIAIRDFNITAKPSKNLTVLHQLQTNPEIFRNDAFLGSVPQAARSNKWRVDYRSSKSFTFGGEWEELLNDQDHSTSRKAGVNMKFWESSGSPLSLFYGVEEAAKGDFRRTIHRYHLRFDQKQGPNQMFSLFLGNVSYQHSIADKELRNNWSARLDYQIRF